MDWLQAVWNQVKGFHVNRKRVDRIMKKIFTMIPEQVRRLSILVIALTVVFILTRNWLVPADFGKYGHYRASAIEDIISQEMEYAGQEVCFECHDDMIEEKRSGYHKDVSCEVCHGPAAKHAEEPGSVELQFPRQRGYCPLCHEYLPSRPTGFPQIVSASHNPMKPCISCHNPHNPTPPQTPRECTACHAEIARTKAVSHHVYVPCTRCHQAPEAHKTNPRAHLPSKPSNRAFCGQCHAIGATSEKGIPRIDLDSHYPRYVCWQCHYPHLPEAR